MFCNGSLSKMFSLLGLLALASLTSSVVLARPASSSTTQNPYKGITHGALDTDANVFLSPVYSAEVTAAAAQIADPTQQANALSVAQVPTFIWFDTVEKVPLLSEYLANASALQQSSGQEYVVQIVIYDLPDRDCAALASNGEFSISDNGQANYFNYIDQIVTILKRELASSSRVKSSDSG